MVRGVCLFPNDIWTFPSLVMLYRMGPRQRVCRWAWNFNPPILNVPRASVPTSERFENDAPSTETAMYEIHLPDQPVLPIIDPRTALSAVLVRLKMTKRIDRSSRNTLLSRLQKNGSLSLNNETETVEIIRRD